MRGPKERIVRQGRVIKVWFERIIPCISKPYGGMAESRAEGCQPVTTRRTEVTAAGRRLHDIQEGHRTKEVNASQVGQTARGGSKETKHLVERRQG